MLNASLPRGEDFQFALRAIDKLFVSLVRVFERDLAVLLAVRHQEGNAHTVQHAVRRPWVDPMNSSMSFAPHTQQTCSQ